MKCDLPVDSEMLKVAQELTGLNEKLVPLAATIQELQLLEREQLQERIRMTALVADLRLKTADAEKAQQGMEKIV